MENGKWTMENLLIRIEFIIFYFLILFIPTQLGKHFWPEFAIVSGIRVDYLSPTLYFTDILIGLLFIIWALRQVQKAKRKRQNKNVKLKIFNFKLLFFAFRFKFYAALLLFLVINIFLSQNIFNGFYHLLKLLEFSFVGFYVAFHVKNTETLQKIILFSALAVIGESFLALWQFFKQGSIGGLFYFLGERTFSSSTPGIANASINGELILRPYATFPHPNVLAGFLLCIMILSLGFFKTFKISWQKSIIALSLLLGTAALILTMSRIAIIIWMMIVVFSICHFPSAIDFKFKNIKIGKIVNQWKMINGQWRILLILGLLIGALISTPFGTRLLSTRLTEESVVQRQELINSSFKLFNQTPIVGIGLGNFLPSLPSVQRLLSPTFYLQPVHNIFLLILAETGIIGFGFFIWFLIKTYRYLLANIKTHLVFLTVITSVLILGLFDHYLITLQQGQLLLAVILGLCWTELKPA